MATQNLLDVIKAGPQKTTISAPKKTPELFVPSKIPEAPKKNLLDTIKNVGLKGGESVIKNIFVPLLTTKDESTGKRTIKETPLMDKATSGVKNTTEKVIGSDTVKGLLGTADYISGYSTGKEIRNKLKEARGEKEAGKIEKAFIGMTYIPVVNSIIDRLIQDTNLPEKERASTKALLTETIVDIGLKGLMSTPTPFIASSSFGGLTGAGEDVGLGTKTWLEGGREKYEKYVQEQLQEKLGLNKGDAQSIGKTFTTSIDLGLGVVGAKVGGKVKSKPASILTEGSIQSAQDIGAGLAFNEDNIKGGTSAAAVSIGVSGLGKKKTGTQDIIKDNVQIKLSDAELDKQISEKASPTKTTKLSPEDAKIYPDYMKNKKDGETFEQYKNRDIKITKKELPKAKKEDEYVTFYRGQREGIKFDSDVGDAGKGIYLAQDYNQALNYLPREKGKIYEFKIPLNKLKLKEVDTFGTATDKDIIPEGFDGIKEKSTGNIVLKNNFNLKEDISYSKEDFQNKIYNDFIEKQKQNTNVITSKTETPLVEEIKKQSKVEKTKEDLVKSQQKIDAQDALYKVLNAKEYDKINLPKKDIVNINDYWKAHDDFMYGQGKELPTVRTRELIDEDLKISLGDTIKIYARGTEGRMVTGKIEDIVVNNWDDFVVKIKDVNGKIYYTEPRLLSNIQEIKPKSTLQQTIKSKNKQPKVEKTKKSATQELSDLQKQKTDLEKRVKNKPQLQRVLNQVNKKISDLESKIKEQPQRLQKSELFPEEAITPQVEIETTPTQRVREKLTKKRAKEIKKAIFDELAERRKIRADKIKQEQNIIKTEEQKIKQNQELIQDNRRKELEEIYLKTDNSKDFEDIVYNDNILSDDNKIKLLEDIQGLETMSTGKSNIEIKKEGTGDIFATPEGKAIKEAKQKDREQILGNTEKILSESQLFDDVKITLNKEQATDLSNGIANDSISKSILNKYGKKEFKEGEVIDIKKTADVKKELGKNKYQNEIEKFEFDLVPGATNKTGLFINLDTLLNQIRIKKGGKLKANFNTFIQGLKSSGKKVSNQIYKDSGLEKIYNDILKNNKKEINNTIKNIEADLDNNLIGGKTPNENIEITLDNVEQIKKSYKEGDKLELVETFGTLDNKTFNQLSKISFFRDLHKGNQEILDKFIPKEIQNTLNQIDELNRKIYDNIGELLVERGQLPKYDVEQLYTRFIMTPDRLKELQKATGGKSIFTTSDGKQFDDFLSMTTYIKNQERLGRVITPEFDITNLSSILKDKGKGEVDLYRYNSGVAQIMDYLRHVGDLQKQDLTFQAFGKLQNSPNKKIQKFTDNFYDSWWAENAIEQTLNISKRNTGGLGVLEDIGRGTTSLGVKAVLYTGADTLLQAATYGVPRTLATKGNIRAAASISKEAKNILKQYGITQSFELSSAKGLVGNKNVALFSGVPIENIYKTIVAEPIMKATLKDAGFDVKKMKPNDVILAFDGFMNKADIDTKLKVMDQIYSATNYMGNSSSLARSRIALLNRLGFTALKTFSTNEIGQAYQQTRNILFGGINESKIKSIAKLATPLITYYAIQKIVADKIQEDNEDITEELAKAQGSQVASQMVGNVFNTTQGMISGLFSNIANLPTELIKETIESIAIVLKNADKIEGGKLGLMNLADFLLRKTQPGQWLDKLPMAITGEKTGRDLIAELLGTPSFVGETQRGVSTGFKLDSRDEAIKELLGYRLDSSTRDYLYNQIDKAKVDINNPELSEVGKIALRYIENTKTDLMRGFEDFYLNPNSWKNITANVDNIIDKQYTLNVLKELDGNKNLEDLLLKLGISVELRDDVIKARNTNFDSIRRYNNQVEKIINENYLAKDIGAGYENLSFSEKLDLMEQNNPKLFNNFVSGLARTKRYLNEDDELDLSSKDTIEKIRGFFSESTNAIDSIISQERKTKALTTDLAENLKRNLFDFEKNIGKTNAIEKSKKQLEEIEKVIKIFKDNSSYTNGTLDSISLISLDLKNTLESLREKGYKDFSKDFPIITDFIKRGLELRGEQTNKQQIVENRITLPLNKEDLGQKTVTSGDEKIGLQVQTGYAPQKKKSELVELLKLEVPKKKSEPLFKTQQGPTLAEILLRK